MFLLRNTAVSDITYPRLVKLFTPIFSLQGSNKRIEEERSYRLFLNYLKEVAAGRRDPVTLGNILSFATCGEKEPVLGYATPPSLAFNDSLPSSLPKANTCINRLTLAVGSVVPEKEKMFENFDLAFVNTHFGMV